MAFAIPYLAAQQLYKSKRGIISHATQMRFHVGMGFYEGACAERKQGAVGGRGIAVPSDPIYPQDMKLSANLKERLINPRMESHFH